MEGPGGWALGLAGGRRLLWRWRCKGKGLRGNGFLGESGILGERLAAQRFGRRSAALCELGNL